MIGSTHRVIVSMNPFGKTSSETTLIEENVVIEKPGIEKKTYKELENLNAAQLIKYW